MARSDALLSFSSYSARRSERLSSSGIEASQRTFVSIVRELRFYILPHFRPLDRAGYSLELPRNFECNKPHISHKMSTTPRDQNQPHL
jgi:hypothetical protein